MRSMASRLKRVFRHAKADAILIFNTSIVDSNFLYLTGFTDGLFERTFLIVSKNRMVLLASALEYDIATRQAPKDMDVLRIKSGKQINALLKKHLKNMVVGVNTAFLPYTYYKYVKKASGAKKLTDISTALSKTREVKESNEINAIKIANRIVKKSIEEVRKHFKVGITEKQLAARFDYILMKNGATGPSFSSIISFGANTALPHHTTPDNTKLRPNTLVLLDVGARYNGYCSDVTRTFIFKPDTCSEKYKRMLEIYNTVSDAQRLALNYMKVGSKARVAHIKVASFIDNAHSGKYKGRFTHALGHSIGIDVHDGSTLSPKANFKLEENMVFSNEPGIYIPGFGGVRIEDDVLITKKGPVVL